MQNSEKLCLKWNDFFGQENLDAFLALAEELRLKGLKGAPESNETKHNSEEPQKKKPAPRKQNTESVPNFQFPTEVHHPSQEISSEMAVALVSGDVKQLDEQIKSLVEFSENNYGKERGRICKVCGKEGIWANIKTHIEANHITSNICHSCDICGKISRSRNGLRLHKSNNHNA